MMISLFKIKDFKIIKTQEVRLILY